MKKTLLLIILGLAAMAVQAQNAQVATLFYKNGLGNTETFYGDQALISALGKCNNGDVITLSGGAFQAPSEFNKSITVRGAGMKADPTLGTLPTVLVGDFRLTNNLYSGLSFEGIYHNGTIQYGTSLAPQFTKCRLNEIVSAVSNSKVTDAQFVHCKIAGQLALGSQCTATCVNCVVNNPTSFGVAFGTSITYYGRFVFTNCVLYTNSPLIRSSAFTNCVVYDNLSNGEGVFHSSNVMNYNVGYSTGGLNIFPQTDTNFLFTTHDAFVSGLEITIDGEMDALDYTLGRGRFFLGSDGTQVGIYGSALPYSEKITGPRITQATVASETTNDGLLSVDITVSAK
ncbi:MAG: hypothetical protein IJV08_10815 [Bacteroidaceae bacterium]|nr:hypothetical protein [Bacteroidaceae bacterium]